MTNIINPDGAGPTINDPRYIPPALVPDGTATVQDPRGVNAADQTGVLAYFQDTQQRSALERQFTNLLNSIPPPNSQLAGVSGSAGDGNPFLVPNALVAFFINMTEFANTLRQLSNSQQELILIQMALTNDLAAGEAQAIIAASQAESSMFIAAAVSSFAESAAAAVQLAASFRGEKAADAEMEKRSNTINENLDTTTRELSDANANVETQQDRVNKARGDLITAENKLAEVRNNGGDVGQATQDLRDAQIEFENSNKDLSKAKTEAFTKETAYNEAESSKKRFNETYSERHQALVQSETIQIQLTATMVNKAIDGAANVARSILALEKGLAEADQKLLSSYLQNSQKMLDQLVNARSENSKMISELMQLLRKFSDDERKLGGSVGVQAAAG